MTSRDTTHREGIPGITLAFFLYTVWLITGRIYMLLASSGIALMATVWQIMRIADNE